MLALLLRPQIIIGAAVVVVIGLLLVTIEVKRAEVRRLENAFALAKAEWAEENQRRERLAREAAQLNADLQARHAAAQQELVREHALELDRARIAADDARRGADELRGELEAFTAAGSWGPGADAAACGDLRDRLAKTGRLLGRADRAAERFAGRAEKHLAEAWLLKRQIEADRSACSPKGAGNE
jgi:hypothetical protein